MGKPKQPITPMHRGRVMKKAKVKYAPNLNQTHSIRSDNGADEHARSLVNRQTQTHRYPDAGSVELKRNEK